MPPVSLPLNGRHGVGPRRSARQHSAHRDRQDRRPNHSHRRLHLCGGSLERVGGDEKNGRRARCGVIGRCCRAALDLARASRHRPQPASSGGLPMRDLFPSLKKLSLGARIGGGVRPAGVRAGRAGREFVREELLAVRSALRRQSAALRSRRWARFPRNSPKRRARSGTRRCRSPVMTGCTKSRSGPGNRTISRGAIARRWR